MPTDKWWADLFLNEDGTTQFREVLGDTFNLYLTMRITTWPAALRMVA